MVPYEGIVVLICFHCLENLILFTLNRGKIPTCLWSTKNLVPRTRDHELGTKKLVSGINSWQLEFRITVLKLFPK